MSVNCLKKRCDHDDCLEEDTLKNERFEKLFYEACNDNDMKTLEILHKLDSSPKPYIERTKFLCKNDRNKYSIYQCLEKLWPEIVNK